MSDGWTLADPEDTAWIGPFSTQQAILRAVDAGITLAGAERDDDYGDLLYIPMLCANGAWWAGVPSALVVEAAFGIVLMYDPEDEWGAPIGYDVCPVERRGNAVMLGPIARTVRGRTHPDEGAQNAAADEVARRAAAPITAHSFDEIGVCWPDQI
ncbi:MAG: hypothetical protein AAFV53_17420 [Myxococcota bacterium]